MLRESVSKSDILNRDWQINRYIPLLEHGSLPYRLLVQVKVTPVLVKPIVLET